MSLSEKSTSSSAPLLMKMPSCSDEMSLSEASMTSRLRFLWKGSGGMMFMPLPDRSISSSAVRSSKTWLGMKSIRLSERSRAVMPDSPSRSVAASAVRLLSDRSRVPVMAARWASVTLAHSVTSGMAARMVVCAVWSREHIPPVV